MPQAARPSRMMEILAQETGGQSYNSHKYSLDETERSAVEYGEAEDIVIKPERCGETKPKKTYVPLGPLSNQVRGNTILTFFLDGSRHVYKIDDLSFEQSTRRPIYPVIAGQIGVGCCRRENKQMKMERIETGIAIALPDIAISNKKQGVLQAMALKLSACRSFTYICGNEWKILPLLTYSTAKEGKDYNDKGTAEIQTCMMKKEQEMVARLVSDKKLDSANFLVKDGSLEYSPTKEMRYDTAKYYKFKCNYNYVIGVSKHFNPEFSQVYGKKPNPGLIADLPLYSRTPVAYYTKEYLGDIGFAVWYIRIREKKRTQTPFDGIIKAEKVLVTSDEVANGMDSDLVDFISAHLINERNPVCYGSDMRWPNHLFPVYLTERFVKSHYMSVETFLHLF